MINRNSSIRYTISKRQFYCIIGFWTKRIIMGFCAYPLEIGISRDKVQYQCNNL